MFRVCTVSILYMHSCVYHVCVFEGGGDGVDKEFTKFWHELSHKPRLHKHFKWVSNSGLVGKRANVETAFCEQHNGCGLTKLV